MLRQGLAVLVLAAAALLVAAAPRAASPTPADLLKQYQPVLLFHADEEWPPESVETYLRAARVERQVAQGRWSAVAPPLPTSTAGCAFSPCLRLNIPCSLDKGVGCYRGLTQQRDWAHPVVYATATQVPATAPPPPGFTQPPKLLLHYWLFYALDDWRSSHDRLWQAHEGDWESISIGLDGTGTPVFAAYSEHCSGTVLPWRAVTRRGSTHPVAYVALGSHANWFSATASDTRFGECLKGVATSGGSKVARLIALAQEHITDRMGSAHAIGPAGLPGVTAAALVQVPAAPVAWPRFPGRWGEGQLLWIGSKPRRFLDVALGYGPGTPRWQATTVSATWHPVTG
jgi:hypothetical protein